jgi:hypothetical protein
MFVSLRDLHLIRLLFPKLKFLLSLVRPVRVLAVLVRLLRLRLIVRLLFQTKTT